MTVILLVVTAAVPPVRLNTALIDQSAQDLNHSCSLYPGLTCREISLANSAIV
jgi:hypothetical protein